MPLVGELNNNGAIYEEIRYGIEIEVEGVLDFPDNYNLWRIVSDGSLRNNGVEFVSQPITRDQVSVSVEEFYQWFRELGYVASPRTGIHVHVDVNPYTMEQVRSIAATYALMEPVIFKYFGLSREENIYCIPWYRSTDDLPAFRLAVERGRLFYLEDSNKYSALNLMPIATFGTLEFRMFPTFTDAPQLELAVDVVGAIVRYGRDRSVPEIMEEYRSLGARAWLARVLGDPISAKQLCTRDTQDLLDYYDVEHAVDVMGGVTAPAPPSEWVTQNNEPSSGPLGYWQSCS